MARLKEPLVFETTFDIYTVNELIGEGGAGRVYGGTDSAGTAVAIKVLAKEQVSRDKRRRFKNETAFLAHNRHPNIVTVIDRGIKDGSPFYVMKRASGSLRELMGARIEPGRVLSLISQILDGVEAAHLQGAVHRDLKPENILHSKESDSLAVADFGIAAFSAEWLATAVETGPAHRLANFQYAAPEQRARGQPVGVPADIYALGLILNEMFTGIVPQGTDYKTVGQVAPEFGFLDAIIASMLKQSPAERPVSIAELKRLIQQHQSEAVSLQKLSKIDGTVVKATEIDHPLALDPPRLIDFDWDGTRLTLKLDRPVDQDWVQALMRMGNYSSVHGRGPQTFSFRGDRATVAALEHEIPLMIEYFKVWLPEASRTLKSLLERRAEQEEATARERLRREREVEEQRLRLRRTIKI